MEHNKFPERVSLPESRLLVKALLSVFVLFSIFILPFYVHNQIVTGSLVNAGLLVGSFTFGVPAALFLSVAPSAIAFLRGLLPVAFGPIIPFIIVGNMLYILVFRLFSQKKWIGGIVGSFVKFIFLFSVGQLLLSRIIVPNLLQKASLMMGWFQLITALIGAGIALLIVKTYQVED